MDDGRDRLSRGFMTYGYCLVDGGRAGAMAAKVPDTTLKDLMARLGRSSPQATLRYLHRTAQADRAMVQGVDDELRQAMAPGDDAA